MRTMSWNYWYSVFLLLTVACLAQPSDVQPPDTSGSTTVIHANTSPGPDLEVNARSIVGLAGSEKGFVLLGDSLVVNTSTQVWFVPGPLAAPIDMSDQLGKVYDVILLSDSRYLIADINGFFVFKQGEVSETPLANVWTSSPAQALLATPQPNKAIDIWIGSESGISLWRSGRLFEMDVGTLPTTNPKLAFGAPYDGAPAIWVASESTVYAIVLSDNEVIIYPDLSSADLDEQEIDEISVDGEGTLWLLAGGVLRSRGFNGQWYQHSFPKNVRRMAGKPRVMTTWLEADDGIWRHQGGIFRKVALVNTVTLLGIAESGYAVVASEAGISRLETGREVLFEGIVDGALVNGLVRAIMKPPDSTKVERLEAFLDGSPIDVLPFPWRVEFDAEDLNDGFHSLVVRVYYNDGGPDGTARVGFFVGLASTPTWSLEMSFLSQNKCQLCHNAMGGNGRDLSSKQRWIAEIDNIVNALRGGRMPLPPYPNLSDAAIDRIELWRDANFPD
jgi:ligand-binding sensor domain-containing protein